MSERVYCHQCQTECLSALDLPGAEDSRGYLNHWRASQPIDDATARRIFKAADQILRAGRESTE